MVSDRFNAATQSYVDNSSRTNTLTVRSAVIIRGFMGNCFANEKNVPVLREEISHERDRQQLRRNRITRMSRVKKKQTLLSVNSSNDSTIWESKQYIPTTPSSRDDASSSSFRSFRDIAVVKKRIRALIVCEKRVVSSHRRGGKKYAKYANTFALYT